ncbi:AMP-binding protein [Rhodoferax sp.]|uniref:AMP-binding protein n=1 Tax=Rhodoferax sp. TaxID=50421 RepID=UPI002849F0D3|nr:AMP-binding protein [Rhodoferax sp.]MDR3371526.1 AMP-binding protein [Rhodoferax sp.]
MTPAQASGLVHAPLADWAHSQGETIAISNGVDSLTFAQLHADVERRAHALSQQQAAATVLVDDSLPMVQRLVDFLGIVASGRCAAVGDPDWLPAVQKTVKESVPNVASEMPSPQPSTPFYVGYTSGSTGLPKGFRRDHRSWAESFRVCLQDFGPDAGSRILAPGRDSHSLFLFGMLLGIWTGAGVVVQERFSAAAALETLRQGLTPCMIAVPSQLILMIDVAKHRHMAPIQEVRLILISGARWMRNRTTELRSLFPRARIVEFYGASETSFIAWMDTDATTPAAVVGRPFSNVDIQIRQELEEECAGLIYVRSPMLFMDYVGSENDDTIALRDGDWLSVRDLGYLDDQGRLCLAGRQNRMIVTQGKNLFAEELEAVLQAHPAIAMASVHGVQDARRGSQVVALIQWASGVADAYPDALQLSAWCRQRLESYKTPRKYFLCAHWAHTISGKTDHRRLAQTLRDHLDADLQTQAPCLTALH